MAAPRQDSLRRRLQSSQEAQHRQALVVRKLQAKVLQYRTRCRELEQQVEAGGGSLPGRWEATEDHSLEKALLQLEEEQQRCENLAEVNALLREQLDKASEVNSALKEDVGKLTADWMRAREELGLKESEWRREREVYESYVRGEHQRLLSLWCQVVTFRRQFLEMKTATDRDLSELKAEHMRLSGAVLVSCSRPTSGDLEKKELQDRVMELSALLVRSQKQNEGKEKIMKTLQDTVEILEASQLEKEHEVLCSENAKEENLSLQKLIKDITEALHKELSARQDSIDSLLQQHRQQEEKCRKLQQRLEQLQEECATSSSQRQHLQSLVEALRSDCANLETTRDELQQQLEVTEQEASRLRQRNTELQLKEDSAQGDKVEQQQAMERARREQELLLKDFAALEGKHSLLQSELVVARETLEESQLQRDLLEQEKHELTTALEKARQSVAELTRTQKSLSVEIADLRAAAANMSSINEALAVEKVQLNNLVLQLEQENEVVSEKVAELERARVCEQEQLSWCERTKAELCAEKAQLEQLLQEAEEQQEGLRVQLRRLAEEKEETQEQLSEVSRQQESASTGLEQLRQESSRQGLALAKVCEEKEVLVQEKAALELRLAAVERDRQGLSEQLAEARPVKETLERSLFEAQQRVSQLEIARSQLEMRLHIVTQAKEVIQGEVKCLQRELEAERSLLRQERENAAQQLLRREQQHDDTLRLRQSDHEAEIQRLLQDLARAREGHQSELQELLERWQQEKAETEREHEKQLLDMEQKVAAVQAQQQEEQTRRENAERELGHRRQQLGEAATGPMDPKLLDLTLGVKISVTPGSKPVFSRGKLGEKLHRPSGSFDLGDPLGRRMSNEYNSLHDPHLQAYHQRKDNVQWLKRQGLVTSDGNVVCSLKEFNQYRQYRTMLKLEAKKASIREQEKLREHLPKLEHAPKLTGEMDTSRLGQRLLLPQKPSCLGQRLLLPQKPSCPPPPKGENNSMKWGRRLRVNAALGKGQSPSQPELGHKGAAGALRAAEPPEISSLHHRQQIGLAAKQLTATVSESLGKHFASGTSEPGPVAGGTTGAGKSEEEKSGQAETAASDRATSKDLLHHLTREAVNIVCSTLEAIGASQSEGGCSCTCSAMLELLRGGVSNRRPQPPQAPFSSPGMEEGQRFPGAPEERSLEAAKGAKWPGPGSGEESRPAEDTRPSTGPQLCRQPVPPAAPKGPAQRAARRRAARGQPVGGEPQQPRQQRGR